jgi:hypothetical protein
MAIHYSAILLITLASILQLFIRQQIEIDPAYIDIKSVVLLPDHSLQNKTTIKMPQPEDIIETNGGYYASLGDGRVVFLDNEFNIFDFVRTGIDLPECGNINQEEQCGRPLGLLKVPLKHFKEYLEKDRPIGSEVALLIADAYKGLLLVLPSSEIITLLTTVNGKKLNFANGIQISSSGIIFLSDTSSKFKRRQVLLEFLDSGYNGRIIKFNPYKKESVELVPSFPFPNGLLLMDDKLLIVSTTTYTIFEYNLSTDQMRVFCVLPGVPDNIHLQYVDKFQREVIWVGMSTARNYKTNILNRLPFIRRLISLLPYDMIYKFIKPYGIIAALGTDGQILKVFQDPEGEIAYISGAWVFDDGLYLGSFKNEYLAKVDMKYITL